jgi:glycine/D-amino acid oxidase-like deaminating enzyme
MEEGNPVATIVVVGAGIVGASVAYRLAQRGAMVTVIEAGDPGGGTSSVSFAWTNANTKRPKAYFDLNVAGMGAYRRLLAEWGRLPGYYPLGRLEWAAPDDAEGWRVLEHKAEELNAWGYPALRLPTARVVAELEPDLLLDPNKQPEVFFYPDEAHVDPPVLIGQLLRAARDRGATVRAHDAVVGVDVANGQVAGVRLASGSRLPADAVVCCCGHRTGDLAAKVGARIPLVPPEPEASLARHQPAAGWGRPPAAAQRRPRPHGAARHADRAATSRCR